jgi:hypothetical protein
MKVKDSFEPFTEWNSHGCESLFGRHINSMISKTGNLLNMEDEKVSWF